MKNLYLIILFILCLVYACGDNDSREKVNHETDTVSFHAEDDEFYKAVKIAYHLFIVNSRADKQGEVKITIDSKYKGEPLEQNAFTANRGIQDLLTADVNGDQNYEVFILTHDGEMYAFTYIKKSFYPIEIIDKRQKEPISEAKIVIGDNSLLYYYKVKGKDDQESSAYLLTYRLTNKSGEWFLEAG